MDLQTLKKTVDELNFLVQQGKYLEALDKYYDKNVIIHQNEDPPMTGFEAIRQADKEFIENVSDYYAEIKNVIVSDDMTVTEWYFKFNHKNMGSWDAVQLSLQRWKNGKIIHERHHFKTDKW